MAIDEGKNLKTITTQELLGSPITNEHTLERDRRENEVDHEKKKKDLGLQLLMVGDDDMIWLQSLRILRIF